MNKAKSEIIAGVRQFLYDNFLYMHSNFELRDDDRLLEKGVIDSMAIVEVISFVESEFGVHADEDEVSEANFGSLSGIAKFVTEKQAVVTT